MFLSNVWQRCYPTFDKGVIQRLIKVFSNVVNKSFQRCKQVFSNIRNKYFQILGTGVVAISLLRCLNSHHLNNNKRMVVDGWSIGGRKSTQRTIDHHYKRLIYSEICYVVVEWSIFSTSRARAYIRMRAHENDVDSISFLLHGRFGLRSQLRHLYHLCYIRSREYTSHYTQHHSNDHLISESEFPNMPHHH